MCSIIGYKGRSVAAPILVDSLKNMEYRGYDSVGLATLNRDRTLQLRKGVGKVMEVNWTLELFKMPGRIGIGHTRWATHGSINDLNAHPHCSCSNRIAVVHNGIIENYMDLRKKLERKKHVFKSETDTEVIAHLLEEYYPRHSAKRAMMETCKNLKGSYAFVAVFDNGTIAGARYDEPLIIGISKDGYFFSSDVLGFIKYTDKAIFLDNYDIVVLNNRLSLSNFNGRRIKRAITQLAWELGAADKGKYAHFTLKEINEQRFTIARAAEQDPVKLRKFCDILLGAKNVYITGSGTSYHSALIAKHLLTKFARLKTESIMSSEFQYTDGSFDEDDVVVAISQSGETADILQSVKMARGKGTKVLGIVNVPTSSLARMSDSFLQTNCGPEIGVAATKSFTGQLGVFYNIIDALSNSSVGFNDSKLSQAVESVLAQYNEIAQLATDFQSTRDIYLLGRAVHYPIALEGALKLKELAYVHAEGIAAGELKHGPLALMDKDTQVIILNPSDTTCRDTLSNAHEIKARGARVIGISDSYNDVYDHWVRIPTVKHALFPLIEVIPLQILAYNTALKRNADPDYPRNLAKSVTVK